MTLHRTFRLLLVAVALASLFASGTEPADDDDDDTADVSTATDSSSGSSSSVDNDDEEEVPSEPYENDLGETCVRALSGDGWSHVAKRLEIPDWDVRFHLVRAVNLDAANDGVLSLGSSVCLSDEEREIILNYEPAPPEEVDRLDDGCGDVYFCVSWVEPTETPEELFVADQDEVAAEELAAASGIKLGSNPSAAIAPPPEEAAYEAGDWEQLRDLYQTIYLDREHGVIRKRAAAIFAIADLRREGEIPQDVVDHYLGLISEMRDHGVQSADLADEIESLL